MDKSLRKSSPYSAAMTREQFLFYEMRTTAQLKCDGLTDEEIINRIIEDNLFQYPTEKSVKKVAKACINRLGFLDAQLIRFVANKPAVVSKQICLYAMMKQYRIVWDFMITEVGEKFRMQDLSFGKKDLNVFFMRLQETDPWVATWSDTTISKLKQVIVKMLVETEYLDDRNSERLNPVLIEPILEDAIRANGDTVVLPAFNCFM